MNSNVGLQEKVREELVWDPCVDATHIGVTAEDGIVTLSGYVSSYFEKKKCERIAKGVANVKTVVDELGLKLPGMANRNDLDIAESAVSALNPNVLIPKNKVQVTVDNGWVSLEGEVDWQYQRNAAEDAIRPMLGIKGISNKILVKPAASASDVKSKIQSALVRNAQVDANNITVDVDNGTAILRGQVRSWAESEQVEAAAWAAPGITKVHNHVSIHF